MRSALFLISCVLVGCLAGANIVIVELYGSTLETSLLTTFDAVIAVLLVWFAYSLMER